tara:strand:+ start:115 stop:519 length:405 start_codon:yes stop_codon:yes gene_type:complete
MVNYLQSKIYKIISLNTDLIYIGSTTTTLTKRLYEHKSHKKNSSMDIINYGDYKIILIEKYPCKDKDELRMREQYHIDINYCVNKQRAYTTKEKRKEQQQKNSQTEKFKLRQKEYRHYKSSWGNLLDIKMNVFQ